MGSGFSGRRIAGIALLVLLYAGLAWELRSGTPLKIVLVTAIAAAPILLFAVFSAPLVLPYGIYLLLVPFDNLLDIGHSQTLTKMLGILSGLAIVAWCVRKRSPVPARWSVAALVALLAWGVASALWSADPFATLFALPTYGGLALLYLALSVMPCSARQFRFLIAVTMCGALVAAAYGAYVFFTNPAARAQDPSVQRLVVSAGNAFVDPNLFADSLLLPAAIALMIALRPGRLLVRIAGFGAFMLAVSTIFLSASREAAIALALIVAYYFIRSRYRTQLAFVTACALVLTSVTQAALWARFANLASPRPAVWAVGFEAFRHRWLTGYGLGTFQSVYDTFYLRVRQVYPNGWQSPSHSVPVHFMVELGLVGFLLLGWFVYAHFVELREIGKDDELYDYRIVMEAGLLAIVCAGLFIDLFSAKWAWIALALAAQLRNAASRGALSESADTVAEGDHRRITAAPRANKPAAAIADLLQDGLIESREST